MANPDKFPVHHAFDSERGEIVDAEEKIREIEAEMDLMRPGYQTARIALNPSNSNAGFDAMTRDQYQQVIDLWEKLEEHLNYYRNKQTKKVDELNIKADRDEEEPTLH